MVYAQELGAPPDAPDVEPVRWLILTTELVNSFEDAIRILEYYRCRWAIELFFRILKSGCKTEDRRLETADRLKRILIFDSIVASRVLYLTTAGRATPDVPCSVVFDEDEWKALYLFVYRTTSKVPKTPPPLGEVTRLIGRLGGHLGRKRDGEPGQTVMWRGLTRLTDIAATYSLLTGESGCSG